jgi:adenine-specific DNA-methyltransferase
LVIARDLLTEAGSVFVQIGDENAHLVRNVLDEVFGSDNFIAQISVSKTGSLTGDFLSSVTDYVLWYGRSRDHAKYRKLFDLRAERDIEDFSADPLKSGGFRTGTTFDYEYLGRTFTCAPGEHWKVTRAGLDRLALADRLAPLQNALRFKRYWQDFPVKEFTNVWQGFGGAADMIYVVQTNRRLVERCLLMTTDPGDLVLDPTCGSGTTAYVAEQWGRRWITIDTSRVALALARSRLMAAKYPYYLLADSEAGIRKEAELTGQAPPSPIPPTTNDVRRGFVYERVPHVTLKSIAQNPDIQEGMSREEIDAAIAHHAETETLFDRPYEDRKIVRVSGPFTVESLSPHRVLIDGPEDLPVAEMTPAQDAGRFVMNILDNLRRAGVQNTKRAERLEFTRLDPYPGVYVQGLGEYVEAGASKTVAIAIGPEFGTVGPELIRDAAKEAVKVADLLVVCGFAFDPMAGEEASTLGRLTIVQARMNPDLSMGDELLKKTGTANLFMVFGEPDIDVRPAGDGQLEVEIRGLDVYDPTTGELRSSSVDDIAAWFLDTDYDGDAFFVRHAYFTGADDPYDKLRRALRADISDETWATINSTVSRPFSRPQSGKIAIKVINHYGDEVMKVFTLR